VQILQKLGMGCDFPLFLGGSWVVLLFAFCALVLWIKHQKSRLSPVVPCAEDETAFMLRTRKGNILKAVVKGSIVASLMLLIAHVFVDLKHPDAV